MFGLAGKVSWPLSIDWLIAWSIYPHIDQCFDWLIDCLPDLLSIHSQIHWLHWLIDWLRAKCLTVFLGRRFWNGPRSAVEPLEAHEMLRRESVFSIKMTLYAIRSLLGGIKFHFTRVDFFVLVFQTFSRIGSFLVILSSFCGSEIGR